MKLNNYLNEYKELTKKDIDKIIKIIKYSREIVEYGDILRGLDIKKEPDVVYKTVDNINKFHKLLKSI